MPIGFDIVPQIPPRQPYALDIKSIAQAVSTRAPNWSSMAANALVKIQDAVNLIQTAQRKAQSNTISELLITNRTGKLIGWIGDRPPYFGAWFQQIYIGATGPDTAPFFANVDGDVVIGKNGSLALQDGGGNEVGWLGVQADAPKTVTGATNATPIVMSVAAHGYEEGDTVFIAGVGGNTAANGYRIVKNPGAGTFEITDLSGVNVAGSGAYTTGGTSTRYFGGGRFQTIAIGESFTNFKLRAFADGHLEIKDALITLTDLASNGYIELNPSGPEAIFRNTATGEQTRIFDGFASFSNYITPGQSVSIGYTQIGLFNAASDPNVTISSSFGAGNINVYDSGGSGTIGLSGASGQVSAFVVDSGDYLASGVPGIDNTAVIPTGFSVATDSAVTSVDFGAMTTTSATFITSITYTDLTFTTTKGLLTSVA